MDIIFQLANLTALISWIILAFFSKNAKVTDFLKYAVISFLSLTYIALIAPVLVNFKPDTFSSIANIQALFSDDRALTAGWVHYLAFDLFTGIYIVKDAVKNGISRWKYTICLPFTFMFGPLGLLVFYAFKWTQQQKK